MPCPSCSAAAVHEGCEGFRLLVETDEPCPAWEAHRLTLKKERRLSELGIPAKYREATASGYRVEGDPRRAAAKRAAAEWFGSWREGRPERGLLFFGDVGSGKTMLSAACLRGVVSTYGVTGRFAHLPALADSLRERIGKELPSHDLIEPVLSADVAVLDELSAQKMTDWWAERLSLIVGERYSRALPTLVTSELALDDLRGRLPERVLSRLHEMCQPVDLRGVGDWRKRNRPPSAPAP